MSRVLVLTVCLLAVLLPMRLRILLCEGLGWMLAEMALLRVRQRGLKRVCLLTEHATDFFAEKFGFRPVPREQLPLEVQLSWEYKHCCGKAVAMMHDLSS